MSLLETPTKAYSAVNSTSEYDDEMPNSFQLDLAARKKKMFVRFFFVICLAVCAAVLSFSLLLSFLANAQKDDETKCSTTCQYSLVESIPQDTDIPTTAVSTYSQWMKLIGSAEKTIHFASFYWTLTNTAVDGNGYMGNDVYQALRDAKLKRNVEITIIQSVPSPGMENEDTKRLAEEGIITLVDVDLASIGGILHTKFMVVDGQHIYVGSANSDWRSLAQVKELGISVTNCSCVARDLEKIFGVYRTYGETYQSKIDAATFTGWPHEYETKVNAKTPLSVALNDVPGSLFISSAPDLLSPPDRASDLKTIINIINNASSYVHISVMDYWTTNLYTTPHVYWGEIDNALRGAMLRNVHVKLLISQWNYTNPAMYAGLTSLQSYGRYCDDMPAAKRTCSGSIEVKIYRVPDLPSGLSFPHTRVNHAKYMVTESFAFIGTSNWSKDYFYTTAGVSVVTTHRNVQSDLEAVFNRDFTSQYARKLSDADPRELQ